MRKAVLVAVPVLALAAGCGHPDYAPYYVGTYAGAETVSFTSNTSGQTATASYQVGFQIAEGSGGSDLVFVGSCGMTGHASSANNFITYQNQCQARMIRAAVATSLTTCNLERAPRMGMRSR